MPRGAHWVTEMNDMHVRIIALRHATAQADEKRASSTTTPGSTGFAASFLWLDSHKIASEYVEKELRQNAIIVRIQHNTRKLLLPVTDFTLVFSCW